MWKLYVLQLDNGCFYVGITLDVDKRFLEHVSGVGARFTQLNKPLRIVETCCCGTDDRKLATRQEDAKTLEYAVKYGGDKVKGGKYFIPSKLIRKANRLRIENGNAMPRP